MNFRYIKILFLILFFQTTFSLANSDLNKIDDMYDEGTLSRSECIKAKKKILGSSSSPNCKKTKNIQKEKNLYSSQGSAFFISREGHFITNNHVISGCDSNAKIRYKTREVEARIIAKDKFLDLALLQAKNIRNNNYLNLSAKPPEKLQRIIAVGYPFGKYISDDLKFTSGIISSIKGAGDDSTRIQIDAALNPGNSGGPIVDEDTGELVGVAVSTIDKSISEGTNFAIKSSSVKNFLVANSMPASSVLVSMGKSRSGLLKLLEETTIFTYCE
jgi:S1-C subfamily serine protease